LIGAIIGAALIPIGELGTRLGIWPFTIGLLLLAAGVLLAFVAVVLGIIALIVVFSRGRTADRPLLYIGLLVAAAVVVDGPRLKRTLRAAYSRHHDRRSDHRRSMS
jgi:hypothetical protein